MGVAKPGTHHASPALPVSARAFVLCHGVSAELLLADDGAENTGKFLLRLKDAATNNYILSVIFKGQATHHQVINDDGWTVNKKPTEAANLGEVSPQSGSAPRAELDCPSLPAPPPQGSCP